MVVGFALSGGGAKGDFELGALRLLYDRGVRPDIMASTSVGSINASKLAEGEPDAAHPDRGLPGLEKLWESLQRNEDMYREEAWLHDPNMDPRIRDLLTGRSSSLGIAGPQAAGPEWGDFAGLLTLMNQASFLATDGAALLKSLDLMTKAKNVYNLGPIRTLLYSRLDVAAIAAWAAAGKRWRIAAVALESGRLRYINESGAVLERDLTPVTWPGPKVPTACQTQAARVQELESDLRDLQAELAGAAPGAKAQLVAAIRRTKGGLAAARTALNDCVAAQPSTQPLVVDIREAVMASASIPAIFATVALGDETYVDGGVREILPIQVLVDDGATEVFAISASPFTVPTHAPRTYANAGLAEVASRSLLDLMLSEVGLDDLNVRPRAGSASTPNVHLIAPDAEVHDTYTIDPGLIQINRDYGWMRAADVLDGAQPKSARWRSATDIALTRLNTWRAENLRYGHEDPTRRAAGTPAPDPTRQADVDSGKARLSQLLADRQAAGGPNPAGIDRWVSSLELHPWSANLNDAAFVVHSIPANAVARQGLTATVTMRNTGTTTWSAADGYRLGSQSPQDNTRWGIGRIELPSPVAPGQTVTFTANLTAPGAGTAPMQWRMVRDGVEWFGVFTPPVNITVSEPPACAGLRAQITAATSELDQLRRERDALDPRDLADRAEIRHLAAAIAQAQSKVSALRTTATNLGCG